jgi:1-acyl-sn-glycerol-3-phosphate acyltransferase
VILLRSALFNVWFFGTTFVLGFYGVFVRALAPARSLALAQLWAQTVLAGARVICRIRVEITGLDRLPPGAALLASQHQSAFDTLIWVALLPRCSYVFKAELGRIPLFGPMLYAAGQIPLDRAASISSVRELLRATQRAKAQGRQIVIFPEGTRVAFDTDATIRGGFTLIASRTGLPIYPVSTDSGRYWSRRAFTKRPGCVRIHIGEPIAPDLPGPQLISVLKQRWREAGLAGQPVGKSVDQLADDAAAEPPDPALDRDGRT